MWCFISLINLTEWHTFLGIQKTVLNNLLLFVYYVSFLFHRSAFMRIFCFTINKMEI